jgi:hypothetical protein
MQTTVTSRCSSGVGYDGAARCETGPSSVASRSRAEANGEVREGVVPSAVFLSCERYKGTNGTH